MSHSPSDSPSSVAELSALSIQNSALKEENQNLTRKLAAYDEANNALRDDLLNNQTNRVKLGKCINLLFRTYQTLTALEIAPGLCGEIEGELGITDPTSRLLSP